MSKDTKKEGPLPYLKTSLVTGVLPQGHYPTLPSSLVDYKTHKPKMLISENHLHSHQSLKLVRILESVPSPGAGH